MPRPDSFELLYPCLDRLEDPGIGRVQASSSITPDADQVDLPEDAEVLGHRRLIHPKRVGDVIDRMLARADEFENRSSPRFRDRVVDVRVGGCSCHGE